MARTTKRDAQVEETEASPDYTYTPDPTWRARKKLWAEGVIDTLRDIVFAMAKGGATKGDIAEFFGITPTQVSTAFDEQWSMGRADLKLRIARRTVELALESKMPVGTIWAGKIFNGFTEQMSVTDASEDASGVTFNVKIATKPKDVPREEEPTPDSAEYH